MSDQPVRTLVDTLEYGELAFQEYFVHRRCEPRVKGFRFAGIESARPAPGIMDFIAQAQAVVICPSNPWVSVAPILAIAGLRSALEAKTVIAVAPIIGGQTVKGPAAKMYAEMGIQPSALAVARHYGSLLSAFILDSVDAALIKEAAVPAFAMNTLMKTVADRRRLAQDVLNCIQRLR
jgi:LPPG:FO 2-phospho-L-lactate transferase